MKAIVAISFILIFQISYSAEITVQIEKHHRDKISVYLFPNEAVDDKHKITLSKMNGKFYFLYNLTAPCVVRITDGKNIIYGVLEENDMIRITYDIEKINSTFKAEGNGGAKFFPDFNRQIHNQIAKIAKNVSISSIDKCFKQINECETVLIDNLLKNVPEASQCSRILKGYCKSIFNYLKRRLLVKVYPDVALTILRNSKKSISNYLRNEIMALLNFENDLHLSPDYVNDVYYTLLQEYMTLVLSQKALGSTKDKYTFYFSYLPDSELRDRVFCLLLSTDFKSLNDKDYLIQLAEEQAQKLSAPFSTYLTSLSQKYGDLFRKGKSAPHFSLTGVSGKEVLKSDFSGKVVVLDFWYKNCAPCLSFFEFIKPLKAEFSDSAVVFLNVSIDSYDEWVSALNLFKISGIHSYTNGQKDAHPIIGDYLVNGYPTVCILDGNGNFFNASPPIGNLEELRKQIKLALKIK